MKISFSTRGWKELTWDELKEVAIEMDFAGIEVYDLHCCKELTDKGAAFHKYNTQATVRGLRDAKLEIPCFDTSIDITSDENSVDTLKELISIAGSMSVPYVACCVMNDNEEKVREALDELVPFAEEKKVCILITTNGAYSDTKKLRELMDSYACDFLAALWDVHHPFRDDNEPPAETITNLGAYVKHVHMKDSDSADKYNLIGEGNMPIDDIMRALASVDYDGFISLEWNKKWMEELTDYEIIFPYFVNYMHKFEDTRGQKKKLYFNHDGKGQYIWKKDELIDLTFSQVLDRVAEEFPDQYAFKYTTLDYTRTYEEFKEDVDNFARALVSMGVKAGSKVAIWATNVPAWYITFWATTKIGAVLVTVNTAYKIHEAEYLFRQSDTHTLVMVESALDSNYAKIINEICPELKDNKPGNQLHTKRLPFLRNVITVGFNMPGCLNFEQAMDRCVTRRTIAENIISTYK